MSHHSVTVSLSPSCIDLLTKEDREKDPGCRLAAAIAYFLAEDSSEEAGHIYPKFRREEDDRGPARVLSLAISVDLWRRFTTEAERQRVSPDQLLEHAALFFAAQEDAGRVAERFAGDLGESA